MNDMMNLRRCKDRNGKRSEDEELGNPFFEGDWFISNEMKKIELVLRVNDYENGGEESMPVMMANIKDVIEREEGFKLGKGIMGEGRRRQESVVVVANGSLLIQ
ncbi:hypothetical protein Tco_0463167 [Tanacetum coccineum]